MPPKRIMDPADLDVTKVQVPQDDVYKVNPHRYEFKLLDGILYMNHAEGLIAGYRKVRDDEFWVRGHIPGRPLFPGVLMIETAAQLVSYYTMTASPGHGFLGFAGVDGVRFRGTVVPGDTVIMVGKVLELRARRCIGATQAFVNGEMVYEGTITGMWI